MTAKAQSARNTTEQTAVAILTLAAAGQAVPEVRLDLLADGVLAAALPRLALAVQEGGEPRRGQAIELAELVLRKHAAGRMGEVERLRGARRRYTRSCVRTNMRHAGLIVVLVIGLLPRTAARAGKAYPLMPRCAAQSSLSVVEVWHRSKAGKSLRVRGRVEASVGCIDTPGYEASCVGDMTLAGGHDKSGTYLTLPLRGELQGVKLECTSDGGKLACPVRIGRTVVATGRLECEPNHGFVLRVESLCQQ